MPCSASTTHRQNYRDMEGRVGEPPFRTDEDANGT